MERPDPHEASQTAPARAGPLTPLSVAFRAALADPDVRAARMMVADAADGGAAPEALYVDVVRPALAELQAPGPGVRARLAAGIGEAILADLVSRLPSVQRSGAGRAAVVSCRDTGIEAVDGSVAMDFLEADGWSVQRLHGDGLSRQADVGVGAADVPAGGSDVPADGPVTRAEAVELAVAVTAGPRDALRLAPACTVLRRLPDPPVIILCDFSGGSRHRAASTSLGADAIAHDPGELVRCAADGLPAAGGRRWGVRLSRSADDLMMAPTGQLDAASVERLADVALTRLGTFSRLVLDLRDLARIDSAGVRALNRWTDLWPFQDVELLLLADEAVQREFAHVGAVSRWHLSESLPAH